MEDTVTLEQEDVLIGDWIKNTFFDDISTEEFVEKYSEQFESYYIKTKDYFAENELELSLDNLEVHKLIHP